MNCDHHRELLLTDVQGLRRVARWIHLRRCRSCRAEAATISAVTAALGDLPRFDPPQHLLAAVLSVPQHAGRPQAARKERETVRRVAYAAAFLVVLGIVAGALLRPSQSPSAGGSLLAQAAYAMTVSDTLHVVGDVTDLNLADRYYTWSVDAVSFERWYSPEGFRFDYYGPAGELTRSVGGVTATGQAWQFYPGWRGWAMARAAHQSDAAACGGIGTDERPSTEPAGAILLYDVGSERLAAFVRLSRERFAEGDLRVASIEERGHEWQEYTDEWQGRPVTVIQEDLGPGLVSGDPCGHVEYYLDAASGALIGLSQFGPESEGHPLQATVDVVEYGLGIPASTFAPEAPEDAEAVEGEYYVRPSGDILFRPGPDSRTASVYGAAYEDLHYAGMGALPWEEAESSLLLTLEQDPDDYVSREYLGRMYTRWGMHEEALLLLPEADCGWSALNRAFCYDALGKRDQALELYEKMKDYGHDSIAQWARLGLQRPTWPKDLDISPEPGEFILKPRPSWAASAFNSSHPNTPEAAIDGDRAMRWGSGGDPSNNGQAPGNWFLLDFGESTRVSRILLDHYGVYVIVNDWPRGIRAEYTADGETWQDVPITPAGPVAPATVHFDPPQSIRAIRFETTEYHTPEWWSIHEIYVYAPYD